MRHDHSAPRRHHPARQLGKRPRRVRSQRAGRLHPQAQGTQAAFHGNGCFRLGQRLVEPRLDLVHGLDNAAVQLHRSPAKNSRVQAPFLKAVAHVVVVRLFAAVLQQQNAPRQRMRCVAHHGAQVHLLGGTARRQPTALSVDQGDKARQPLLAAHLPSIEPLGAHAGDLASAQAGGQYQPHLIDSPIQHGERYRWPDLGPHRCRPTLGHGSGQQFL